MPTPNQYFTPSRRNFANASFRGFGTKMFDIAIVERKCSIQTSRNHKLYLGVMMSILLVRNEKMMRKSIVFVE